MKFLLVCDNTNQVHKVARHKYPYQILYEMNIHEKNCIDQQQESSY